MCVRGRAGQGRNFTLTERGRKKMKIGGLTYLASGIEEYASEYSQGTHGRRVREPDTIHNDSSCTNRIGFRSGVII